MGPDPEAWIHGDGAGTGVLPARGEAPAVLERHLAVLEQVVERRQQVPLRAVQAVEDEDPPVQRRAHRRRVHEGRLAAREDLLPLLQVRLGRVPVDREVLHGASVELGPRERHLNVIPEA